MNLLNYTLAGVIGAFIASLATYRICHPAAADDVAAVRETHRATQTAAFSATLARVSRENAELKARLDDARATLAAHEAALKQTTEQLEELRRPMTADILSSALRADMKSGEVVVTGGYKLPNGRRLYAFAQPVIQQVDGKEQVKIESRFLSVTDAAGTAVGLDTIATNVANTLQHGEVWVADEQASVLAKLNASPEADLVTSPSISVLPGSSGAIQIGDLTLKVTPEVAADHATMNFEVRLEQPQQEPAAPVAK